MHNPFNFADLRVASARAISVVSLALLCAATFTHSGFAMPDRREYAGIVIDAKTGKTLYEKAADAPRYPASVTKVMTLYILFQELEAGHLKLSSRLTVSEHAAAAVPTKLGLRAGATISVEDAIKSIVTLSANDIARTIAENIEGSEAKFAKRMTATARELGMNRTTYDNASGLPDPKQITTARDQARLGIAIYEHFPQYYDYFQTRSFTYGGRTYGNHNRLLGNVAGVDGIKTGYIRDSGYNLLTAARTQNRHIVVVGFGFDTGSARNAKVTSLVKAYLPKARSGTYLASAKIPDPGFGGARIAVASATPAVPAPFPDFRTQAIAPVPDAPIRVASAPVPEPRPADLSTDPGVQAATLVASTADPSTHVGKSEDVIGAWISQSLKLDENAGVPVPPARIGQASNRTIDLLTSGSIARNANSAGQGEIGWVVQVGAAPSERGAQSLLADAASTGQISDMRRYVERIEKNGQVFFRARFAGFTDRDQAWATCQNLKKEKMNCLAIQG